MVRLILGEAGSGKTKQMLEMANAEVETTKGEIAYIEATNKHMHQLHRDIRFIATEEFQIDTRNSLYGLVCGLLSANYDIEKIYIDGLDKIIGLVNEALVGYVELYDKLADERDIEIIISCNMDDPTLGEKLSKYAH